MGWLDGRRGRRARRAQRGGLPPLVIISEIHRPAAAPGSGVRSCHACGTMWHSALGELRDSGELAAHQARGECRVYSSWSQLHGLTCHNCDRSWCLADHLERPDTGDAVPQADDYACPHCRGPLAEC